MQRKIFGFWKEQGEDYLEFPSVNEYISNTYSDYEKKRIVNYLISGGIVCVTSSLSFPNIITGKYNSGSMAIKTDGKWEWPENLVDYISNHDVVIPKEWYEYMKSNDFNIPELIKRENQDIDWGN